MFRKIVVTCVFALIANSAQASIPVGGFSDVGLKSVDDGTNKTSTFYIGGIDFYYTTNLDEKTSVLAEIVYEFNDKNEAVLDPERLYIQYNVSPLLKIKAGREHTAIGYWNNTYHHGTWLQTTTSRPLMYRFEDDGGILPVHNIGLELSGSTQAGMGELSYALTIGNGRNKQADPPQNVSDESSSVATGLSATYTVGDVKVGASFYKDDLPGRDTKADGSATTPANTLNSKGSETITGVHFVYMNDMGLEILAEHMQIKHKYDTTINANDQDITLTGSYGQLSYQFGKWTPYYRHDSIKADSVEDQYLEFSQDKTAGTFGVRYDLTATSALKLESSTEKQGTTETKVANLNWSFAW